MEGMRVLSAASGDLTGRGSVKSECCERKVNPARWLHHYSMQQPIKLLHPQLHLTAVIILSTIH